jgi:hypothetical protein
MLGSLFPWLSSVNPGKTMEYYLDQAATASFKISSKPIYPIVRRHRAQETESAVKKTGALGFEGLTALP